MRDIGFLLKKNASPLNLYRVLRAIWVSPGVSRSALSTSLRLDKSTITKIVADLLQKEIVVESAEGVASEKGGRRPVFLGVRRDFGCVVGLEIQTERYTAVAVDLEGKILYSRSEPLTPDGKPIPSVFLDIMSAVSLDLERQGLEPLGIGVGVSGIVDSANGVIQQSIPLGISAPVEFYASGARLLGKPLSIDNDANCCCWAELVRNRGSRPREFLFLLGEFRKERVGDLNGGGVSIGLGLVIGGRVHLGACCSAGEFRSVFRVTETKSQFSLPDETMRLAAWDETTFRQVALEIGQNLALLVNTLDLSHVFIGGSIEKYRSILIPVIEDEVQRNWPYGKKSLKIELSELGELIVAYGAASMFLERLFSLPEIEEVSVRGTTLP
ncbi:MAG TPA: ROK family transcriptional regulator [Spirochaetia bacterium]|nr:ROK family transcriptional regulator [Spirochaetia bacterium]